MGLFITASAGLKTALDGEASDRKAKVEIKFNEADWVNITPFVDAIEINASLESLSGFATTNTATLKLRNPRLSDGTRPFSSNFYATYNPATYHFNGVKQGDGFGNLRAGREIRISATAGANEYIQIFTGFIDRSGFQEQEEGVIDKVSISCWDRAKKLIETKCLTSEGDQIAYANYKICDSTTPASSLVHSIAGIAGVAAGDIIADDITGHSCTYVALDGNVWEELSKIAEAYLTYLYFDGNGKLRFVGSRFADGYSEPNPPTSEWDFDKDNLIKIQKDHTEVVANHVKVQHKAYELAANKEIIYRFVDENTWDGKKNAYNIPKDDQTLPWTDPTVNHFLEFATPGGEKIELAYNIDSQGEVLLQSTNGNISIVEYTVYANKVKMRLQNTIGNDYLEKLEVEGKPVRNTKIFNITEIDQTSIDKYGKKSKEIGNKYFSSDTQAQIVCAWHRDLGAHPRQLFTLTVPALLHCQTGAWVKIILTNTGIGGSEEIYCRLDKYSHQFVKKRKAVTELILLALIYNWSDSSSATPQLTTPNTPQNAIPVQIDLCPTYTDIQDGYNAGGGTTTPTQVTITECKAIGLNAITLHWNRQLNLTNFDHYEVQVSSNQTNWYSLRNDGVDWKGTLGGKTLTNIESVTHENIPHGGTEDEPTEVTLYYRVRRVTKETTYGNWSANASVTTVLADSGHIKPLAITTAKIDTLAVTAEKTATTLLEALFANIGYSLTIGYAGTGTPSSPDEGDRRIYLDDDEILFQIYTKGAWSTERQIALGGVDSNGNFRPFLGCRGLLHDIGDAPTLDPIPSRSHHLFKWNNNAQDQHGNDPWTVTVGAFVYSSSVKWEGTHSLAPSATLLNANYAANWNYGDSVTGCFMFRHDGQQSSHGLLEWGTGNDRITLDFTYTNYMRLEISKGGTATSVLSAALSANTWHFVGCTYDADTNTAYLRVDNNEYSFSPSGTWGSGTGNIYLSLAGGGSHQRWMDDLLFSHDTAMDPDLFFQHVNRAVAWTAEYFAADLLLKPKPGGRVVIDDSDTEPSGGTWHKIEDPPTGWLASKTSWTVDSFSAGLEIDFSDIVPAGTKAVKLCIMLYCGTNDSRYVAWRKAGDTNISNTPFASAERCATVGGYVYYNEYWEITIWLSSDLKADFTIYDVASTQLYIGHPSAQKI